MKKILYVIIMLLCVSSMRAQYDKPFYIPAPTTTSIMQYGDVPVSYFTGRINLEIPIYETNQNGVPLKVSFSYDSSGILANTLPGWTGHSWSLQAGGAIMRQTKGWDIDERTEELSSANRSGRSVSQRSYGNYFKTYNIDLGKNTTYLDVDTKADIFNFSFMGKSGKFYLGHDGQWKVESDENLAVEFDIKNDNNYILPFIPTFPDGYSQQKYIKGFTLIDENGTRYIFGGKKNGDVNAIEYSMSFTEMGQSHWGPWDANTWYLSEVQDRFGNVLYSFEYERGMFMITSSCCEKGNVPSMSLVSPVYLKTIKMLDNYTVSFNTDKTMVLSSHDFYSNMCSTSVLSSQINTNGGEPFYYLINDKFKQYHNPNNTNKQADPLYSMGICPLSEIQVKFNGSLLDAYCINYNNNRSERLHIVSIVESIKKGDVIKEYKFKYKDFNKLTTDYLTTSIDGWGYYTNSKLRNPDEDATQWGALTEIQYPTGGKTTFTYRNNVYRYFMNPYRQSTIEVSEEEDDQEDGLPGCLAGGLRIMSIADYDSDGKVVSSKKYRYDKGAIVSRLFNLSFESYDNGLVIKSPVPVVTSCGNFVGYSKVTETLQDGTVNEYYYRNLNSYQCKTCWPDKCLTTYAINNYYQCTNEKYRAGWVNDLMLQFDAWTERHYQRGKMESVKTYYNKNLVSQTDYIYGSDWAEREAKYYVLNHQETASGHTHHSGSSKPSENTFRMFYFRFDPVKEIHKTKMGNVWVTDTTTYNREDRTVSVTNKDGFTYQAYIRALLGKTVKRGNQVIEETYSYPYLEQGVVRNLVNQFYLPVTTTKRYFNNEFVNGSKTVYCQKNNQIVPEKILKQVGNESASTTVAEFKAFTPEFMPKEVVYEDGINYKYFRNNNNQIVATVANGSGNISLNASATSAGNVLKSSDSSEIFGTKPVSVTSCTYDSRGLVSNMASANKLMSSYKYDSYGRLSEIDDNDNKKKQTFSYNYMNSVASTGGSTTSNCLVSASFNEKNNTIDVSYTLASGVKNASIEIVPVKVAKSIISSSLTIASSGSKSIDVTGVPAGEYYVSLVVDGIGINYKTLTLPGLFPTFSGYMMASKDASKKTVTVYYQDVSSNASIRVYRNTMVAADKGIKPDKQYTMQTISSGKGQVTFNYSSWPSDSYLFFLFVGGNDQSCIRGNQNYQLP